MEYEIMTGGRIKSARFIAIWYRLPAIAVAIVRRREMV